ncbi:zinc-ribbon domain-containing protein [Methylobacter sp. YRD-M1]|uniref:zinc ribbon domain-containing protein n=1 Tax=Methylobacter sp. YRD-M1 TaxID=2911520 RepID=UPI003FA3835C
MKCEKCQSELSPDARFCSACGHPVAIVAPPLPANMGFCPNCGAKCQLDERFCGECGQALPAASPQPAREKIANAIWMLIAVALLIYFGILAIGFFITIFSW